MNYIVHLDQHVQKYFKSPPKSPEQSLNRRQGSSKVNRPVQQFANSYLTATNPNLSKRRDKVCLILICFKIYYKLYTNIMYILCIRIIEHLDTTVEIIQISQQIVLNQVATCPRVDQYQTIKMSFLTQNCECQVCKI